MIYIEQIITLTFLYLEANDINGYINSEGVCLHRFNRTRLPKTELGAIENHTIAELYKFSNYDSRRDDQQTRELRRTRSHNLGRRP